MTEQDTCVIFNPTAGRRRLSAHLAAFRRLFGPHFEPMPTQHAGHAEQLAYEAAAAGFGVVAAAGGDGTVHEVANGILRADRPDVALRVVPVGSANDYAASLGLADHTPAGALGVRLVDVGLVRGAAGRRRYFVNGLGAGFNGAITLEARKIRYLRGVALYSLGLLRALCYRFRCPEMSIAFDDMVRRTPTLALTVNLGRREGNFVMAPEAVLDDGLFDYVQAGRLRRWETLRLVPAMILGKLPEDHPQIWQGRCRRVTVESAEPLTVHLDGEFFCQPQDRLTRLEIECLPGRLRVLAPAGTNAALRLKTPAAPATPC